MPSIIQLVAVETSLAEKPWIGELLELSLDKKSFNVFLQTLIKKCVESRACPIASAPGGPLPPRSEIIHETFIQLYVPFSEDEVVYYNPPDDLLYRLKLLDETSNTQYSKTLYAEVLHYRAVAILRRDPDTEELLRDSKAALTRKFINENLYHTYHDISYRIDDEFALLVNKNKLNVFYRCEISEKIAALLQHFQHHQSDLESLFVFLKLGELSHAEFPGVASDQFQIKLPIFTSELSQLKINQFYSFDLSKKVCDRLLLRFDREMDTVWSVRFGMLVLFDFLQPYYKTPEPKPFKRINVLIANATKYVEEDLLALSRFRLRLDNVINDIILYGREKALIPAAKYKSDAALGLGRTLQDLSYIYFSNPEKNEELKEKFYSDCLLALKSANLVLSEHRSPRWQRITKNVLLAVSAVITLGLTLVAKRYYSKLTTGSPTFFNDVTRGIGKTRAVAALIEKEKTVVKIPEPEVNDISMTRISRSPSI
jgi:hypothetical protein